MQNTPFLRTLRNAVCASLLVASSAHAQLAGTQTGQIPNVLLLVDTSGSMERMSNGTMPTCNPGTQTTPNRWGSLVQALTGSFQPYFSCSTIPRTSPEFTAQYTGVWNANSPAGSNRPPDYGYVLPYNRPLTGSGLKLCGRFPNLITAGALSNADRGDDLLGLVVSPATPRAYQNESCVFDQADDGQLDAARPFVRFGLMTFDSDPSPSLDAAGSWSYFKGSAARGSLPLCPVIDNEVGGRSSAAPEWEGPLVPFPPADADLATVAATNERVQRVLSALRPSGATPLDGLMTDARTYLLNDADGPSANDPYYPGCREQYVILLTDGAPNLDMRPECKSAGGACPYADTAKDVAFNLRSRGIQTFVIGFSVNGEVGAPTAFPDSSTSCTNWFDKTTAAVTGAAAKATAFADRCTATNPAKESSARACCVLHEISMNGNQEPALFAESQSDLAEAFGTILGKITKRASTRTVPVYSTVSESSGNTASFFASFEPSATRPWSGNLDRQRLVCGSDGIRLPADIDAAQGDRYSTNLTAQNAAERRRFLFAVPDAVSGKSDPSISLRRGDITSAVASLDAAYGRTFTEGFYNQSQLDSVVGSFLTPSMLGVTTTDCRRSVDRDNSVIPPLSVGDCSKAVLGFATAQKSSLGLTGSVNGTNVSYDFAKLRCPPGSDCQPLGAIFRAEPAYSGPPTEPLRDDSYQVFATQQATRTPLLYVATTDGLVHALKTNSVGAAERFSELWSFIPPAVLPLLRTNMPRGNQILLDGSPTVKDVIYDRGKGDVSFTNLVATNNTKWRTSLVAGFGVGVRGYYALDVTNPGPGKYDATTGLSDRQWVSNYLDGTTGTPTGPHMMWQLTTVPEASGATQSGNLVGTDSFGVRRYSLFGKRTAKPAITTLFFVAPGSSDQTPREIAVAILPGGIDEGSVQSGSCPRAINTFTRTGGAPANMSPTAYAARPNVRRWSTTCNDAVAGRTLVVVRLDTGEVVRVFGRRADVPQALVTGAGGSRFNDTPLDSPMSGTPVVYPGGIGTIGQKVIAGDADGTVWRFDLTATNPQDWTGSLFFDTQSTNAATPRAPATAADIGQPILVTPVAAATDRGELMVGIATGEQESFTAPSGTDNFVYALTETTSNCPIGYSVCTALNWYQPLLLGERVSGPMTIFDRTFYFATYAPATASGSVCRNGLASLWGMDFIVPKSTSALSTGGVAKLTRDDGTGLDQRQDAGGDLIPGVSIRQLPACGSITLPEYGGPNGGTAVFSPGTYQLVIPRAGAATGGQNTVKGAQTNIQTKSISTLSTPTRMDSFAAIVE